MISVTPTTVNFPAITPGTPSWPDVKRGEFPLKTVYEYRFYLVLPIGVIYPMHQYHICAFVAGFGRFEG